MRLRSFAQALIPLLSFIAQADPSANATRSPTLSGTSPSTKDRSGTVISKPPNARDEERNGLLKELGWGDIAAESLIKYRKALRGQELDSLVELKDTWWRADGTNPHLVYGELELNKLDENILSDVRFHAWVKHVHDYNLAHPEDQVSIMRKLHEQFGDRKLSLMLEKAKGDKSPLLRAIGTKLQTELMSYWKGQNVSPKQLYKMLQADEHNPSLLIHREYHIWNIYFSNFMPGKEMEEFEQLYQTFGEADLTSLLISATRSEKTETWAKDLQIDFNKFWLKEGKTPRFVFERLMLDKNPDRLLDRHELYVWLHYAEMYRTKRTTDVTLYKILKSYYSEDQIEIIIKSAMTIYGRALATFLAAVRK